MIANITLAIADFTVGLFVGLKLGNMITVSWWELYGPLLVVFIVHFINIHENNKREIT